MKRQLDPVDLIVAVGLCATMLGGYLIFLATNGTIGAASAETATVGLTEAGVMGAGDVAAQWVQPALGEAIVTDYLLEQAFSRQTVEASTSFNRATMAGQRLADSPSEHFARIGAHAAALEADHAARVQYVMGREIVNFTARGVRAGILSPAQGKDRFNRRMIRKVGLRADRMDAQFLSHRESNKGWEIVAASQVQAQYVGQVQQRIGSAVVRVTQVQQASGEALAGAQEQLASAALAAIRTEELAERFARLAAADFTRRGEPLPLSGPRSWPEVPVGLLLAGSMVLAGLFFAGLFMQTTGGEVEVPGEELTRAAETVYRKTA
jgi:hypothetical protein